MHFSRGEQRPLKGGSKTLPDADLFIKPRSGSGGHRMERWDFQAATGRFALEHVSELRLDRT